MGEQDRPATSFEGIDPALRRLRDKSIDLMQVGDIGRPGWWEQQNALAQEIGDERGSEQPAADDVALAWIREMERESTSRAKSERQVELHHPRRPIDVMGIGLEIAEAERRRELAIYRAVSAGDRIIDLLIWADDKAREIGPKIAEKVMEQPIAHRPAVQDSIRVVHQFRVNLKRRFTQRRLDRKAAARL